MAVSKRLRYEVLRRDNHACRYCGRSAPEVALTVDHVVPVALGGSDDPTNLVAACRDCNAGKSASSPDAQIVDDIAADALRDESAWRFACRLLRRLPFEQYTKWVTEAEESARKAGDDPASDQTFKVAAWLAFEHYRRAAGVHSDDEPPYAPNVEG